MSNAFGIRELVYFGGHSRWPRGFDRSINEALTAQNKHKIANIWLQRICVGRNIIVCDC